MWNLMHVLRIQKFHQLYSEADHYEAELLNKYVLYYSLAQGILIIMISIVQTYTIRKLFQQPKRNFR